MLGLPCGVQNPGGEAGNGGPQIFDKTVGAADPEQDHDLQSQKEGYVQGLDQKLSEKSIELKRLMYQHWQYTQTM